MIFTRTIEDGFEIYKDKCILKSVLYKSAEKKDKETQAGIARPLDTCYLPFGLSGQ